MILRIARSKSPGILIFLIFIAIGMWWSSFHQAHLADFHFDQVKMPLYEVLSGWIGNNIQASVWVAFFVLIIQAFMVLRFNQEYMFIST